MAEFYPNTVIKILKDVPLDASYTDVLDFASETAQNQYFSSKSKYAFNNVSYQRVNYSVDSARPPLTCTVPMNADNLYDCNYIMFQNANYGTKWFYAYIVNVGFVSANVSKISYVLDDYQTWLFDFTVGESYVLREHTNDDTIGANVQPEPFQITNYVLQGYENDCENFAGQNMRIGVATIKNENDEYTPGNWVNNKFYTGVEITYFTLGDNAITTFLNKFQDGKEANILYIQLVPINGAAANIKTLTTAARPATLDDYPPDNNKLFTYPYCKLTHINSEGQGNDYKYEYFNKNNSPTFYSFSYAQPIPEAITYPHGYQTSFAGTNTSLSYYTSLKNFPMCTWVNDTFSNWYARNEHQLNTTKNYQQLAATYKIASGAVSTIGTTIAATAATVATGGAAAAALLPAMSSGLSSFSQGLDEYRKAGDMLEAQLSDMEVHPDTLSGGTTGSNILYMLNKMGNHYYSYTITFEQARRIDSFFNMYGYATNEVKIPNLTGRSNFNYVKLQQPYITGSIPVESMINIKKIFSNGVRIWHNAGTFMNYNVKNNIKESSNDNNETT